jgi:hypothetical protein
MKERQGRAWNGNATRLRRASANFGEMLAPRDGQDYDAGVSGGA